MIRRMIDSIYQRYNTVYSDSDSKELFEALEEKCATFHLKKYRKPD